MILGIDTGGTFTDFVLLPDTAGAASDAHAQLKTHKVLSTPDSPERAILQGIEEMGLAEEVRTGRVKIIHGSTVATNAALEGKGVKTAFITNTGFRDTLTIARQTRPALYQLETKPVEPPVPRELCFEIAGRIGSRGEELAPLREEDLQTLAAALEEHRPSAIAVSLLFSFLHMDHEQQVTDYLSAHLDWEPFITRSSEVLPEYREYERGIATWLNATLGPLVRKYLLRLQAGTSPSKLSVMQSSGGTIDAAQASRKSVNLLLSGPAGGLAAAAYLSRLTGQPRLMTFDMGGTSTDVALLDGKFNLTTEGHIGDYPVAVPMVDMHTIGAGGGSIAAVDAGGLLQVGPRSAGASPGPACYDLGGRVPTVTDANLILGRLQPDAFMGGAVALKEQAAGEAMQSIARPLGLTIEEAAAGVIRVANEHMARALRVISVARGYDPKMFRLCCFGGAGGLHICALADAMDMTRAMVPAHAGVLSAMGMFLAPVERQLSLTHRGLLAGLDDGGLDDRFAGLEAEGIRQLAGEGINRDEIILERSVDLRYRGQSSSLNIPWTNAAASEAAFHDAHGRRYGHRLNGDVELVNLRVSARHDTAPPTLAYAAVEKAGSDTPPEKTLYGLSRPVPVIERKWLAPDAIVAGPALIVETNATTWLAPEWCAQADVFGNLLLNRPG